MSEEKAPEARVPFVYVPLSPAKLEQLAQDIVADKVFIRSLQDDFAELRMAFMVLSFLDVQSLKEMQAAEITTFYEYMEKAGPRSVNGLPCFHSMNYLNREQHNSMVAKVAEIRALLQARTDAV